MTAEHSGTEEDAVTGYTIEIGYLSAGAKEQAWGRLRAVALDICEHPERITDEVFRLEPANVREVVSEYAQSYKDRVDLTIHFYNDEHCIRQLASGGGESRDLKEACRRAMCRLLLEAMHRERIELSIIVS